MTTVNCEKCNLPAKLFKSSMAIYSGKDRGPVWVCGNWPRCDARVGCHKGTHQPLGTLADKKTRRLRELVHAALDPLWKNGHMSRSQAYFRLADEMLIDHTACHIAMFNALRCKAALDCIKRIRAEVLHPSKESVGADYVQSETTDCPFEAQP